MADTKISAETAAGTLDGTEIVPVVKAGANRRTTAQDIANLGGGGGGLFGGILSAVPTAANTGLATWINQGSATIADAPVGLSISAPSNASAQNMRLRHKVAPATPYTITALVAMTPTSFGDFTTTGIGFYDNTNKLQLIEISQRNTAPSPLIFVNSFSTPSALNATHFTGSISGVGYLVWLQIADDGTNVAFRWSADGYNFKTLYTVAKASGYLGGSGYTNVFFGVNPFNTATTGTLLSWDEA